MRLRIISQIGIFATGRRNPCRRPAKLRREYAAEPSGVRKPRKRKSAPVRAASRWRGADEKTGVMAAEADRPGGAGRMTAVHGLPRRMRSKHRKAHSSWGPQGDPAGNMVKPPGRVCPPSGVKPSIKVAAGGGAAGRSGSQSDRRTWLAVLQCASSVTGPTSPWAVRGSGGEGSSPVRRETVYQGRCRGRGSARRSGEVKATEVYGLT